MESRKILRPMITLAELINEQASYSRASLIKKAESFDNPLEAHFAKIYLWPSAQDTTKHCKDIASWIYAIHRLKCSGKKPKLSDLVLVTTYPLNTNDLWASVRQQGLGKRYPLDTIENDDSAEYAKRVNRLISLLDIIEFDESSKDSMSFKNLVTLIKEIIVNGNMTIS